VTIKLVLLEVNRICLNVKHLLKFSIHCTTHKSLLGRMINYNVIFILILVSVFRAIEAQARKYFL